mgnify:CR=1 FL=1
MGLQPSLHGLDVDAVLLAQHPGGQVWRPVARQYGHGSLGPDLTVVQFRYVEKKVQY